MPVDAEPKRSCNRHDDCDEAERFLLERHPGKTKADIHLDFHCHREDCEDIVPIDPMLNDAEVLRLWKLAGLPTVGKYRRQYKRIWSRAVAMREGSWKFTYLRRWARSQKKLSTRAA